MFLLYMILVIISSHTPHNMDPRTYERMVQLLCIEPIRLRSMLDCLDSCV